MAVIEHPDFPKSMLGIQGLNVWNLLLFVVLVAWALQRKKEGLKWDMPRHINVFLLLYLLIIFVGFLRMIFDLDGIIEYAAITRGDSPTISGIISEYLINTIKWVIPGMLLFDGCRSRSRLKLGVFSLLLIYFLLTVQVIKWMPLSSTVSGDALSFRSLKVLDNEVGYHRVNLSMMLAGASWAIFSSRLLLRRNIYVIFIIAASLLVLFGQSLTAGRMGYTAWILVGLVHCFFRWRKYFFLVPFLVIAVISFNPGSYERMFKGFTPETHDTLRSNTLDYSVIESDNSNVDLYTVTAGRSLAWPLVIEKIGDSPLFGYGREAMQRTGITMSMFQNFGSDDSFPHPHNAYLQFLLDNGWFGFIPVVVLYLLIFKYSVSLFRDFRSPVFVSIGGVTFSLVLALLVASIGSQTFYPREGAVGMWCSIGLMLRVYVERKRILATMPLPSSSVDRELWPQEK